METDAASSAKSSALADEYRAKIESHLEFIDGQKLKAESVVERAEEAYRIATTTGLAGAFEDRAREASAIDVGLDTWSSFFL